MPSPSSSPSSSSTSSSPSLSIVLATATFAVAALLSATPAAHAQSAQASSPHTLSGNVGIATEYRYRGIAQTDGDPTVQGGVDYAHASGLYAGTWGSNVSWLSDAGGGDVSSSVELDLYGGYKGAWGDFGYDVGVLRYFYPGTYPAGFTSPHTTEVYIAGTWQMLTLKYSHSVTNLFGVPDSEGSGYFDVGATFDIGSGFALNAHAGHQSIPSGSQGGVRIRSSSDCSYTDWKLGVSKEFVGLNWGLAYIDTNAKGDAGECYRNVRNRDLGKSTVVLSVGRTF